MRVTTCVILGLTSLLPQLADAQEETDFLFGMPRGAFSIRGGYMLASANSDIYEFFAEELTVEPPSDFNAFVFGLKEAHMAFDRK